MGYDVELADRMRFLIGTEPGISEKKIFGGIAFLVNGNMAISASSRGGALARVDPDETESLIAGGEATVAVMGGREMQGWVRVPSENLDSDDQLANWIGRTLAYVRQLPPKQ
jgi:TfoX/Sxy family transcriptional regulator of competence genes